MQQNYHIQCPKCNRPPQKSFKKNQVFMTHLCYEDCGNVYWSLQYCAGCKNSKKIFISKPNLNELIECENCSYQMYFFSCSNCKTIYFKHKSKYLMGDNLTCIQCQQNNKIISCSCGGQIIIKSTDNISLIEGFTKFQCKQCKKSFTYVNCIQNNCGYTSHFGQKLEIGQRFKCQKCFKSRIYVPCPNCGKIVLIDKFSFCELIQCFYCCATFEYSKCPNGCGINYQFAKKKLNPLRQCLGFCKMIYCVINCKNCQMSIYMQQFEQGVGRKQQCPSCKQPIKFYSCPCGLINSEDMKCLKQTCPAPIRTQCYDQKQPSKLQQLNANYNEKQCKLCFADQSTMVNNSCLHTMMCQSCYNTYKISKQNHQKLPCPICKIIGSYHKYVNPIYQ